LRASAATAYRADGFSKSGCERAKSAGLIAAVAPDIAASNSH
jgi:hypothetical protein